MKVLLSRAETRQGEARRCPCIRSERFLNLAGAKDQGRAVRGSGRKGGGDGQEPHPRGVLTLLSPGPCSGASQLSILFPSWAPGPQGSPAFPPFDSCNHPPFLLHLEGGALSLQFVSCKTAHSFLVKKNNANFNTNYNSKMLEE